jgi:hypothetical protein
MATRAAFLLTILCLFALPFAEEISVNVTAVQKLVDYSYSLQNSELLPGLRYNNTITAAWAVPASSLSGLEGQIVVVKVSASASNESDIFFLSPFGTQAKSAEAHLRCKVENRTCGNGSNLQAEIPFTITIKEGENGAAKIMLKSEIVAGSQLPISESEVQKSAGGIFDSLKNAFGNSSLPSAAQEQQKNESAAAPANHSSDFLGSLKPEGNSKDPLQYLQSNPLISIAALGIVVVITGAYLLNAKD